MDASPTHRSVAARQVLVVVGTALAIAGSAWGSGAFGGIPIAEAAGGALAADATLLAPASTAFGIWGVIYAGLVAFAVYQALPSQRPNARIHAVAWWVLASLLLNAAWIGTVQAGLLWVSVAVLAGIVGALAKAASMLAQTPPRTWPERLCVDAPVGLYLGWASVAVLANAAAAAGASIPGFDAGDGRWLAVLALMVAAAAAIAMARAFRLSSALAMSACLALSWGLWWIAVGRLQGQPHDLAVGWIAGLGAATAFAAPFAVRDLSMVGKRDPLAPE